MKIKETDLCCVVKDVGRFYADAARTKDGIGDISRFEGAESSQLVVTGNQQLTGIAISQTCFGFVGSCRHGRKARSTNATVIASLLFNAQLGAFAKTADGRATAIDFITAVTTIVKSIAGHGAINAMAAPASKLVRQTKSLGLTHGRFLVRSVLAVLVIVANFRLRDAEEVAAAEFAGRASKMSTHVSGFIRSIAAVVVAIAAPQERGAFAVGAGEIVW